MTGTGTRGASQRLRKNLLKPGPRINADKRQLKTK
jgi:hypothetical protein